MTSWRSLYLPFQRGGGQENLWRRGPIPKRDQA
jgi:hypothetical protein